MQEKNVFLSEAKMTNFFPQEFPFFYPFLIFAIAVLIMVIIYILRRIFLGLAIRHNFSNDVYCAYSSHICDDSILLFAETDLRLDSWTPNLAMLRQCLCLINVAYLKHKSVNIDFPTIAFKSLLILRNRFDKDRPIGYILYDTRLHVLWIVFRGSMDYRDIEKDVNMTQALFLTPNQKAHRGFVSIYNTFRQEFLEHITRFISIYSPPQIIITGHSLGGGLCVLALADVATSFPTQPLSGYTFGCPRVGNLAFVNFLQRQTEVKCFRIANSEDIFTNVPLSMTLSVLRPKMPSIYSHYGYPLIFTDNRENLSLNHSLLTYMQNSSQLVFPLQDEKNM